MNSVAPVKSTFHSFIDNTTPPSDFNSEAGNPHCCCNASGTDHNIESKLEDHFLKKKTEQSQSKHSPHSVSNPKKEKKFRNRSSEQDLIKSRTDPSYAANLVGCPNLQAFDSGAEPCCAGLCTNGCQDHFRMHFKDLQHEIDAWWGATTSKSLRANNLYKDILFGYDKSTTTQKWFIGDKEVCKNFYVRARGIARTTVEKCQREVLSEQCSFLNAVEGVACTSKSTDGTKALLRDQ